MGRIPWTPGNRHGYKSPEAELIGLGSSVPGPLLTTRQLVTAMPKQQLVAEIVSAASAVYLERPRTVGQWHDQAHQPGCLFRQRIPIWVSSYAVPNMLGTAVFLCCVTLDPCGLSEPSEQSLSAGLVLASWLI